MLQSKVEVPMLVADNEAVQRELSTIDFDPVIISVSIYDKEGALVAERSTQNVINRDELKVFSKDIINQLLNSEINIYIDSGDNSSNTQSIGQIKALVQPYSFTNELIVNKLAIIFNIILATILIVSGFWLYQSIKVKRNRISIISNILESEKIIYQDSAKFSEYKNLYYNASKAVDKIYKQNSQLANLHKEIQYAREDSNLELNRFLEFLMASKTFKLDSSLEVFIDAVLASKSDEKSFIDIRKEFSWVIAHHSDLMQENNLIIFDKVLGMLDEHSVFIDKELFHSFLKLFIKQLALLCKNSELSISADINNIHDQTHILRLSFESSSPSFKHVLEHQSLFDFIPGSQISIETNNPSFIACKHLVQKTGGDFIFLENEIRFEFPVSIIKKQDKSKANHSISALNAQHSLLVYDSDPTERIILMGYLEKFAQKVDKATTKQVTLQKLRRNHYDAVCVNSNFFSSQDPYFLANFKTEYYAKEMPPKLLVFSKHSEIVENENYQSLDAKLIIKPINLKELEDTLNDLP
ncbi:hypothetical protein [Kangiella sp. HZ709]|uniref:hypothetical protein n=1 Tax=Kangiella sp. HZ709 TaxID=2666328 RepID=UPI0012B0BA06|nr:hypothetical protein [Kangiella sp. HZ709]MRX26997.1 hypothetical protein [Kangiella sp. HZ709]